MSKNNEGLKMEVSVEDSDVGIKIHDDLAVSESEDEGLMNDQQQQMQEDDDGGDLWF